MHRIGATADQAGDVVEARHAGIGHEADLWAQASPVEGLVHAADGQQHIEPSLLGIYTAIGEDDDATPLLDRLPSLSVQLFQSPSRAIRALIRRIGDRQGRNTLLVAQPGKAGTAENGILQLDDFGVVLPQNRLGAKKP